MQNLVEILQNDLQGEGEPLHKVLMALQYYATGRLEMSDEHAIFPSVPADEVLRAVWQFTAALNKREKEFIKFPSSAAERITVAQK